MRSKLFGILICLGILLIACKKENAEINRIPEIEYKGINKTSFIQFQDSVIITIGYKDQDGDIGENDPNIYSLSVKDSRLEESDWYHIPPVTPNNEELHVQGTLQIKLNTLFLLGNGGIEYTRLSIQLQDRSGNLSNAILTPELTINP